MCKECGHPGHPESTHQLCGSASDDLYLTFKGGCREPVSYVDAYRCTGCGGRFHKECILEHFKLEAAHDWGRQAERELIYKDISANGHITAEEFKKHYLDKAQNND